jgi:hypothetical protein
VTDVDDERDEPSLAWDRVGEFLQNSTSLMQRMADRNLALWNDVSRRLRRERYTADDLATDTARSWAAGLDNVNDIWALLTRPPARERLPNLVPTAFLFFDKQHGEHVLLDPVYIPVPEQIPEKRELPERALIALDGTASEKTDDVDEAAKGERSGGDTTAAELTASQRGVAALLARLRARLASNGRFYVLENYDPGDAKTPLVPGVYDGLVYLTKPPLPLANVRVVVEGPPPTV